MEFLCEMKAETPVFILESRRIMKLSWSFYLLNAPPCEQSRCLP